MGKFFRGREFPVNQLNVSGILGFMLKILYGMSAKVLSPKHSVSINTNWGQCFTCQEKNAEDFTFHP